MFRQLLLIALAIVCVWVSVASATEIAGKWGLGVGTGSVLGSPAEVSLIRGRSASTAWILDVRIDQYTSKVAPTEPDTINFGYPLVAGNAVFQYVSVLLGPRLRHYTRPDASLSPYFDLFVSATDRTQSFSQDTYSGKETRLGGQAGVDFGVEYFFSKWPVALAAHTPLFVARVEHVKNSSSRYQGNPTTGGIEYKVREARGTSEAASLILSPTVHLRVYF